ncbi:hypothetical protein ACLOJK_018327 [Asimina triloba]
MGTKKKSHPCTVNTSKQKSMQSKMVAKLKLQPRYRAFERTCTTAWANLYQIGAVIFNKEAEDSLNFLPWMDLLPKSDSPDELAGGKTGRRECREADAGWSRSWGRREDRETGVRGGGRWPEPSPENGGGRWDGRSRWKNGMRDVARRRPSGDDRLPRRKTEPEKEGSRRRRGCREGDAGRTGVGEGGKRERRDLREGDAGWSRSRSRRRREGRRRKTGVQGEGRRAGRETRRRRKMPVAGEGRRDVLGSSRWKTGWEEAKMAFAPWGGRKAFVPPRRTELDALTALMV